MSPRDCLFELGTEELPPKSLKTLSDALEKGVRDRLDALGLAFEDFASYATPRRLAFVVTALDARQSDTRVERRGPPVKIAFTPDGEPTKAAQKFIESCGVALEDLSTQKTDKGEWLFFEGVEKGRETRDLLPDLVRDALAALPIARRMRWGSRSEEFVRPVHWSILLWGDDVIETEIVGTTTGRETRGHRFHAPGAISIDTPASYPSVLLENGHVMANFAQRRRHIEDAIATTAGELNGSAITDNALLNEVTALVEWPVPVAGRFNERFLQLPEEVLVSTLKDHQRYFPLRDAQGGLLPWFITLSNIQSKNPDAVRDGNERVVHPRLSDAEFFYQVDRKQTLAQRTDALGSVLFQKQLGTLQDKTNRIALLAASVAENIGADSAHTARAAALCKCDLQTEMVGEFPELQGIMGRYYATHDNEPLDVAAAMAEHYLPRFAGDDLPITNVGRAVAIADRLDTITGIFGIGKPPSGTRDPFGLRRCALGVLRIVTEAKLDLNLRALINIAADALPADAVDGKKKKPLPRGDELIDQVMQYLNERLRGLAADEHGATQGQFDAVLANSADRPLDLMMRLDAVQSFAREEAAQSLIAANKRIANILKKVDGVMPEIDPSLFSEAAETTLHGALLSVADDVATCVAARDYAGALQKLSTLREPVDVFFDDVLVMADDDGVRTNRLALLQRLRELFLGIADFSLAAQ
ncbi:MAG: glycine--tRNA ligase subunit beta [Gammaproteobacteria bacterium]